MKDLNKKDIIMQGLFFGSIWGVLEASLGYVLNMIPFGISGCIMFPIAFFIMTKAYEKTGSVAVIRMATIITALIKLTNLSLPFLPVVKVVNPAFAILLEGLGIALLISKTTFRNKVMTIKEIAFASMGWRIIYLIETIILFYLNIPSRMINEGFSAIAEFLVFGIINTIIIFAYVSIKNKNQIEIKTITPIRIKSVYSVMMLIVAILIQYAVVGL